MITTVYRVSTYKNLRIRTYSNSGLRKIFEILKAEEYQGVLRSVEIG